MEGNVRLNELLTTSEAVKALDLDYPQQLTSKSSGLIKRYKMVVYRVSGQTALLGDEVIRVGHEIGAQNVEQTVAQTMLNAAETRGTRRLGSYYNAREAQAVLDISSRERLYQLSDFRGGDIQTVEFGRTRLYSRRDVDAAADD